MKTVRLRANGMPRESMSFKNIDYQEIAENDEWIDSELYEIFTGRFMFVVFRPDGRTITMLNNATGQSVTEPSYVLTDVFFWTMPASDLATAQEYWEDIRRNVLADNINSGAFWKLEHSRKFHVRPKATNSNQFAVNPNGGMCPKYCYWFNAEYVKKSSTQTEMYTEQPEHIHTLCEPVATYSRSCKQLSLFRKSCRKHRRAT